MPKQLKELRITRISLVDEPASDPSRVVIFKSDSLAVQPQPVQQAPGPELGTRAAIWQEILRVCAERLGDAKPATLDRFFSVDSIGQRLYRQYTQAPDAHAPGTVGPLPATGAPMAPPQSPGISPSLRAKALAAEGERRDRLAAISKAYRADRLDERFPGRDEPSALLEWCKFLNERGLAEKANAAYLTLRQPPEMLGVPDALEAYSSALAGHVLEQTAQRIAERDTLPIESCRSLAESAFGSVRGALADPDLSVVALEKRASGLAQRVSVALGEAADSVARLAKRLDGGHTPSFAEAVGDVVGLSWDAAEEIGKGTTKTTQGRPRLSEEVERRAKALMKAERLPYAKALSRTFSDDPAFYEQYLDEVRFG